VSTFTIRITSRLKRLFRILFKETPRFTRPSHWDESLRYNYQQKYVDFNLSHCRTVLDLGCGSDPFPFSTHLVDLSLNPTNHRKTYIKKDARPLYVADIHALPFPDGMFDYVYCSHVLEHVQDPVKACSEIMRIGRRGYIETPTLAKDGLFHWARGQHRWHVVSIGNTLCFFEYDERRIDGIRSDIWYHVIQGAEYHPLQEAYFENLDFFNTMFQWEGHFRVFVFSLEGTVRTLD